MRKHTSWNTANTAVASGNGRQAAVLQRVTERLKAQELNVLRDRQRLREVALAEVVNAAAALGVSLTPDATADLVAQAVAQAGGLGFLDQLLPPLRDDLSEVAINPDGSVWLLPKGARDFVPHPYRPSQAEVWRAVEALLAPLGRAVSEAHPSVDAKLPRMQGMGGARIKVLHPRLCPGDGFPAVNIRLFEPRPVTPEQIVAWRMAPEAVMDGLLRLVADGYRMVITGGTATGKTTLLSAIASGIPKEARVIKIEDPEEIWLDHPHVVTVEARPAQGEAVPAYTQRHGVDDALRMAPRWLIVGEVRTGDVAMTLFRAMMSDHPGLTTFHATHPQHAVHRMALILYADANVRTQPAKEAFAAAVDVIVQVGWLENRRQILGIWGMYDTLRGGDVQMETFWLAPNYLPDQDWVARKMEKLRLTLMQDAPQEATV